MMNRLAVLTLTFAFWLSPGGSAKEIRVELSWSDLGPAVTGKNVALVLPDAVRIQGPVLAVEHEALVIDVRKSSAKERHGKGRTTVPRASVSTLELRERGTKWQVIGAGIGAGVMLPLCLYAVEHAKNEGGEAAPTCAALIGTSSGLGWLLGRSADKKITYITVTKADASGK